MSDASTQRLHHISRHTVLVVCAGMLFGLGVVTIAFHLVVRHPKASSKLVGHMSNLKLLGSNLPFYTQEHGGAYPPPEKWCDALLEWSRGHLRTALRYPRGEHEGCPYAMNPRATPSSPPDVVLLFEGEPGWNRTGGPESIRVNKQERGEGAYVLFVGGEVRFVTAEEIPALRWE